MAKKHRRHTETNKHLLRERWEYIWEMYYKTRNIWYMRFRQTMFICRNITMHTVYCYNINYTSDVSLIPLFVEFHIYAFYRMGKRPIKYKKTKLDNLFMIFFLRYSLSISVCLGMSSLIVINWINDKRSKWTYSSGWKEMDKKIQY